MPAPFSRSHIERLGRRLIAGDEPSDRDIAELRVLLRAFDEVLTATLTRVRDTVGVAPTSRLKNTGTILEKLHRSGGAQLKSIQALAGMRIVVDGDRHAQDALVDELVALFASEPREPRVIDRRENPSYGYRAVHVVVFPENMAVEIQVRTRWQHEWADMFEKLADRVGRGIRYGAPPDHSMTDAQQASLDVDTRTSYDLLHELRLGLVELALLVAEVVNEEEIAASGPGSRRDRVPDALQRLRRYIDRFDALPELPLTP